LSLVRRLTQMHGGTVTAASKGLTHGSTFTLRLPLLTLAGVLPVSAAPIPPQTAPVQARRILVVDDNVDSTESLTLLLQLDGHDVRAALDGHTAIVAALAFRPQVVLLDIGLPDLDGLEVARHFRTRPETKRALLIALTGYARPEDRQHCMDAGFDHHLVKPLDFERLKALMAVATAD
jgi:CheY-like chemotaxis protein